jgi:hypothetical protein
MVGLSDISLNPEERTLRQFAAACILFLGGLGAWKLYRHGPVAGAYVWMILGIAVGALGLVAPKRIRLLYVGAMFVAFPIGWVVSHVLLAVLYGMVMTPIGLLLRALRRDRLRIERPQPEAYETYWITRPESQAPDRYLRQF